jgi:hypothetical protein
MPPPVIIANLTNQNELSFSLINLPKCLISKCNFEPLTGAARRVIFFDFLGTGFYFAFKLHGLYEEIEQRDRLSDSLNESAWQAFFFFHD